MHTSVTRPLRTRFLTATVAAFALALASTAMAASYHADLSGPNESPPVASPGIGTAQVDTDPVAHTMRVRVNFTGLVAGTTASHIHAPTPTPLTGTASVATTTPSFVGFPLGVTFGNVDITLDMTLASSYRAGFITSFGGTPATAETALFGFLASGQAYLNIHTSFAPGGEIRGFLVAFDPTPTQSTSWGRVKSLFR